MIGSAAAPVAALILSAGGSRRMGRPKALLPFHGTPLVRRIAREALASRADRVAVVAGAEAGAIRTALAGLGVDLVVNEDWENGLGSSLAAGVRHLRGLAAPPDAIVVLLADQPFVVAASIDRLIAAREQTRRSLVAVRHGSDLGVPALFAREHFEALEALTGDHGARDVLRSHAASAAALEMPEARVDVDTPQDYAALPES